MTGAGCRRERWTSATKEAAAAPSEDLGSVRAYERQIIVSMLRKHRKANRVAIVLGIARSTLYRKFAELDINPAEFTGAGAGPDETH